MKLGAISLAFALVLTAAAAHAQQTRFYGPDGKSTGTAVPYGNGSVRYYGPDGKSTGTAVPYGNGSVRYYGPDGRSLGTSTTTSTGTTFYDARGNVTGRTSMPGARR